MTLVGFLVLASSAFLMVQVVHTNEQCASFSNQTTLVPGGDGHTVTMTFSVVNMCTNNTMKSIKVSKMNTDTFYRHRFCTLSFQDKSWRGGSDCVYKEPSQTFSVTSSSDNNENEAWILVGVLQNGDTFNTTVQSRSSPDKPGHVSFILVVAVSVGVIVSITFVTIITVSCVRSKNNLIVETRPRMDSYAKPDQRSSHRQATAITNEVYRGSNVSLMIENDIYDGTAFQLT